MTEPNLFWYQIFISIMTLIAYWLVTDKKLQRWGLWWTLVTEFLWVDIMIKMNAVPLTSVSLSMIIITLKRLREPQKEF